MNDNEIDLMNNFDMGSSGYSSPVNHYENNQETLQQNPYEKNETAPQLNPYESSAPTMNQNPYESSETVSQQNSHVETGSYVYTSGWMNTNSQQPVYRQQVKQPSYQQTGYGQPVQEPVYGQMPQQPVYQQPINLSQYTAPTGGGYYYVPAQYAAPVLPKTENKGLAIAGMVCGILSIVFCCLSYMAWYLAIPGLIMSIAAVAKKYKGRGMAIAGIICSSLGLILSVGFFVFLLLDM